MFSGLHVDEQADRGRVATTYKTTADHAIPSEAPFGRSGVNRRGASSRANCPGGAFSLLRGPTSSRNELSMGRASITARANELSMGLWQNPL